MPYGTGHYGGGSGAAVSGPTAVSSADSGAGAEGTPALVVTLSSSDTGSSSSTESVSVVGVSVSSSDTGTSSSSASIVVSLSSSDSGSSSSSTTITASLSATDSGSGIEPPVTVLDSRYQQGVAYFFENIGVYTWPGDFDSYILSMYQSGRTTSTTDVIATTYGAYPFDQLNGDSGATRWYFTNCTLNPAGANPDVGTDWDSITGPGYTAQREGAWNQSGSPSFRQAQAPASPGDTITASVVMRAAAATGSLYNGWVFVRCYNSGGGQIGVVQSPVAIIPAGATRTYVATITAPAGTAFAAFDWSTDTCPDSALFYIHHASLQVTHTTPTGHLVADWPLHETSGSSASDIFASLNGTYHSCSQSGPIFPADKRSKFFDGAASYVDLASQAGSLRTALSGSWTIEAWCLPWFPDPYDHYVFRYSDYGAWLKAGGGSFRGGFYDSGGGLHEVSTDSMIDGATVFHVAVTWDDVSGVLSIWSNNLTLSPRAINQHSLTTVAHPYFPAGSAAIGRNGAYSGGYFHGSISNVIMHNRAITIDEFELNEEAALALPPDGPAYFFENVGPVLVADSAGGTYFQENATTDTPTPHIWYLTPTAGDRGAVVEVVGMGFGPVVSTYGGVLLLNSRSVYPTVWERLAPVSSGTAIDPAHNTADPEHDHIEFFIPSDAHSGDVQVMLTSG